MARSRPFSAALIAALAGLAGFAVPASADLVYIKGDDNSPSLWIAADDGRSPRKLADDAAAPRISADASHVVYLDRLGRELWLTPTRDGEPRRLARASGLSAAKFSPDGQLIAVVAGRRLLVFETATARMGVVARGRIGAFSFSPDGQRLAYDVERGGETDIHAVSVLGGESTRLTRDGRSLLPAWGPARIAFVKRKVRSGAYDIWTMTPERTRVRRVTKLKVPDGASGLAPIEYSADGRRMIAQYVAGEVNVGFTVNPFTGKTRALRRKIAFDLASDGSQVLTQSGGAGPGGKHNVYAAPYAGGRSQLLVRDAYSPSWSR
jgi:hypothetical protein